MLTQAPKGTKDLYGAEVKAWIKLEETIRLLCEDFGISEIRTPIFEYTDLFKRGVGETTDIVNKEMYTFNDMGKRSITLKPEVTSSVVRAYIENGIIKEGTPPTKFFYISPAFRQENVQKGRQRQFHQFGVEVFGTYNAVEDAQVISLAYTLFKRLGLKNIKLHINSLGCSNCRLEYNKKLKEYISQNISHLCDDCKRRYEKNPLRVLDCKEESCRNIMANAPSILDTLDDECKEHFELLQEVLTQMEIPFIIDSKIVRGLDYYTRTVFEFISEDLGSQSTVCGGGRYDSLVKEIDGQTEQGAVGFAIGIERLLLIMEAQLGKFIDEPKRDIYIGSIGKDAFIKSHALTYKLRQASIKADSDDIGKSVKAQMKYANKIGSKYSMIIGDDEINLNTATVKNMETGEQVQINLNNIIEEIKKLLEEN